MFNVCILGHSYIEMFVIIKANCVNVNTVYEECHAIEKQFRNEELENWLFNQRKEIMT